MMQSAHISSTVHSPAPWRYEDGIISDAHGYSLAQLQDVNFKRSKETDASGRLMAAAPELLAAAKNAADILASIVTDNESDHGEKAALNLLAGAIAKAEGTDQSQ